MRRDSGERNWLAPIARAAVAIITAVVITFSADHSPPVGYLSLGAFGILSGAILIASSSLVKDGRSADSGLARWFFVGQGVFLTVAGVVSVLNYGHGLPFLLVLTSSVFAATGIIELVAGLIHRRASQSRDWIFAGALSAVLGLAVLLIPANFSQHFTGPDGVERALTASVILVGAFGAYAAILGVYLVIAGLSIKWNGQQTTAVRKEKPE